MFEVILDLLQIHPPWLFGYISLHLTYHPLPWFSAFGTNLAHKKVHKSWEAELQFGTQVCYAGDTRSLPKILDKVGNEILRKAFFEVALCFLYVSQNKKYPHFAHIIISTQKAITHVRSNPTSTTSISYFYEQLPFHLQKGSWWKVLAGVEIQLPSVFHASGAQEGFFAPTYQQNPVGGCKLEYLTDKPIQWPVLFCKRKKSHLNDTTNCPSRPKQRYEDDNSTAKENGYPSNSSHS